MDELLVEMRELVLDATPEDFDAMKVRYDQLHREACTKATSLGAQPARNPRNPSPSLFQACDDDHEEDD